jgi:hypothetical protein
VRLYIDLSCFNRPFDDQVQERIRRETEAVFVILNRILEGKDDLVWSWVLTFENSKHPKPDRGAEIALWEARASLVIHADSAVEERARRMAEQGIPALDAAHLASAEAGGAEIFVTCDDVVLRRSRRLRLGLRVLNPVAYWETVSTDG